MGFELPLSFRVNFLKSILIGVNVDLVFMDSEGGFLHCKLESLSFKYRGLHVGDIIS